MRALKILVVAMGVLIVLGTVTLVALIVQRAGGAGVAASGTLAVPAAPGTRIAGIGAADGAVALLLTGPEGERVVLVDPRRNAVRGEIVLAPRP